MCAYSKQVYLTQAKTSYALEGSIAVGGSGVRWLRDNLGAIRNAEDSEAVAASVPDSAGKQDLTQIICLYSCIQGFC